MNTGKVFKGFIQGRQKLGKSFYIYSEIYPIIENGKIFGFVFLGKKTFERETIKEFSVGEDLDLITGLPNQKVFFTTVNTYIERHHKPFLLMIIDIYGFSEISTIYGTDFCEALLKKIADKLKNLIPRECFIAKTFADEFLIALFGFSKEEAGFFITKIFEEFCQPIVIKDKELIITLNIGISSYPQDGESAQNLFTKAIISLEWAKQNGENTYSIYHKETEEVIKNSILQREKIAQALEEKRFFLFVQPYYLPSNREIAGAEILLRIKQNENLESIGNMIDFLENSGLIQKIEDYLFEKIKKYADKIKTPLSINISAKSFTSSEIFSKLADLRKTLGYPFVCEITERLFLEKDALEIIKKIKDLDIKIAIDDFGTGYSSLSYIENLPVDIIKIDISFVRRMLDEPKALAIVQTIIDLAKKLGIKTVAEGVENEEQFRILRLLMCDFVQGYYLSEPVPIEDFIKDEGK